jgi:small-conductance mechanosensitive channel
MGVAVRRGEARVSSLSRAFVWVVILGLGLLWVFNTLGVQVTPLLTALGVGGLAVALALQDTLSNFFAGIHLLLERPFSVGHFVHLEEGKEGYVVDVGWRTTRIRTLLDEVVIIPNNRIASSTLVNYDLPLPHLRMDVLVAVAYESDMEKVERVLKAVGDQAAKELPLFTQNRPAEAYMKRLADWSVEWILRVELRAYGDQVAARHVLQTRILVAFAQEGIRIPYPVQVVEIRGR